MDSLLSFKEALKEFYGKYEFCITPVLRFFLALTTYILINHNLGYMKALENPGVVLLAAIVNAVLPVNVLVLTAALFTILHVYKMSLICAAVVLLLFLLLFLLYFRDQI